MKTWTVELPISGYLTVEVETEDDADEDDAIQKALEADYTIDDITEWEAHDKLVEGNIFYGSRHTAEAFE